MLRQLEKRSLIVFGVTLFASLVFARPGNQNRRPIVVAHRGASHRAPENTLSSVEMAWEIGSSVEVDIRLTRDNRVVVIHDNNTKRTAGEDRSIRQTTYRDLSRLDVGRFKGSAFRGERIPLLSEVLETLPRNRHILVEIKSDKKILPFLERILNKSGKRHQVTLIGFSLDTMATAKDRFPDRPTYWLRGTRKDKKTGRRRRHSHKWIHLAKQNDLDGLDVHFAGVDKRFADAVKAAGLDLYVWTVDRRETATRLARYGVDGITTNRPGLFSD